MPENGISHKAVEDEYEEMNMAEIMNGKGDNFPGLLGLIAAYLDTLDVEPTALEKIQKYLDLVKRRSDGMFFILHSPTVSLIST